MSVVTVYTRPGCHLCEQALEDLKERRSELPPFELREVNIEHDEALHRAYLERIPVFECDAAVVCDLGLDAEALRRALVDTLKA
jgi:hypothetical protein